MEYERVRAVVICDIGYSKKERREEAIENLIGCLTISRSYGLASANPVYVEFIGVPNEEAEQTHNKLREILRSYNNPEWGDCIVDEICSLFGYPTTTDINPEKE